MSVELPADSWWPFRAHPVEYAEAADAGLNRGFGLVPSDGDTPSVLIDQGYYDSPGLFPVRLPGIDTPETRGTDGAEYEAAIRARERTAELTKGEPILLAGSNEMSFRRRVAELYVRHEGLPAKTRNSVQATVHLGGYGWCSLADVLVAEELAEFVGDV